MLASPKRRAWLQWLLWGFVFLGLQLLLEVNPITPLELPLYWTAPLLDRNKNNRKLGRHTPLSQSVGVYTSMRASGENFVHLSWSSNSFQRPRNNTARLLIYLKLPSTSKPSVRLDLHRQKYRHWSIRLSCTSISRPHEGRLSGYLPSSQLPQDSIPTLA